VEEGRREEGNKPWIPEEGTLDRERLHRREAEAEEAVVVVGTSCPTFQWLQPP
jgi:hypothetical protein